MTGRAAKRAVLIIALIALMGMFRNGLIYDVEFVEAHVVQVLQVPGHDDFERAVMVDLGDRKRLLRVSDWMIKTEVGETVCVARRKLLLRRFTYYQLNLPGYCAQL